MFLPTVNCAAKESGTTRRLLPQSTDLRFGMNDDGSRRWNSSRLSRTNRTDGPGTTSTLDDDSNNLFGGDPSRVPEVHDVFYSRLASGQEEKAPSVRQKRRVLCQPFLVISGPVSGDGRDGSTPRVNAAQVARPKLEQITSSEFQAAPRGPAGAPTVAISDRRSSGDVRSQELVSCKERDPLRVGRPEWLKSAFASRDPDHLPRREVTIHSH